MMGDPICGLPPGCKVQHSEVDASETPEYRVLPAM